MDTIETLTETDMTKILEKDKVINDRIDKQRKKK